jgi:hypothetical protein
VRSHSYTFSAREWTSTVAAPLVGLAILSGSLHGAHWLGLLPPARPIDNPDETLLVFKSQLSCSRHPAQVILLGDSSCATGIEAPRLSALLSDHPGVLNLGLFIGFGLDIYGQVLTDYVHHNPDTVRLVVLLVTPQFLTDENVHPGANESWDRAHLRDGSEADSERQGVSHLAGVGLFKDRLVRQVLHTPIRGGSFYGFSSDFANYLARHDGSMVDPGVFRPGTHPVLTRYYLSSSLEKASHDFRRRLPPGVKLAIGITPLPESLCGSDYLKQRNELLLAWNRWMEADYVLTNSPARLGDTFFASGAHLNRLGQKLFTQKLAVILDRAGRREQAAR